MTDKFSKILEGLKKDKEAKSEKKAVVYLVSNSIFIKGTYMSHDEESITISSFYCLGVDNRPMGTMTILLDSINALGSTLSI